MRGVRVSINFITHTHTHVTVCVHVDTASTLGTLALHTSGRAQARVSIPALVTTGLSHSPSVPSHVITLREGGTGRRGQHAGVFRPDGPRPLLASQTCWLRGWHLGTWGLTVPRGGETSVCRAAWRVSVEPRKAVWFIAEGLFLALGTQGETIVSARREPSGQDKEESVCPAHWRTCQFSRAPPLEQAWLPPGPRTSLRLSVGRGGGLWGSPWVPSIMWGPHSSPLGRVASRASVPSRCGLACGFRSHRKQGSDSHS